MIPFETMQLIIENSQSSMTGNMIFDLNDYNSCVILSYAPVSRRRRSDPLGDQGVYAEEKETIIVQLRGDTQANVLGRLEKLNRFMDYASLWPTNNSAIYRPVRLRIKPADSFYTSPYNVYIYCPTGFQPISAAAQFDSNINQWVIDNVKLEFYSRSLYLEEEVSASVVTVQNGRIAAVTLPAWSTNFPITLINNTAAPVYLENLISGRIDVPSGLYAVAALNYMAQISGPDFITGTDWSTVADAARFPTLVSNNISRFTPTAANTWRPTTAYIGSWGLGTQLVWWKVRSSSTTPIWLIRTSYTVGNTVYYSDTVTYQAASIRPAIIPFNPMTIPEGAINFAIEAQCNVTGQTLDFDAGLIVTDIDRTDLSRVIQLTGWNQTATTPNQRFTFPYACRIAEPAVFMGQPTGTSGNVSYTGDANLEFASTNLVVCWFAVPGTLDFWRVTNTANSAVISHQITAKTRPAHVVPV